MQLIQREREKKHEKIKSNNRSGNATANDVVMGIDQKRFSDVQLHLRVHA